MDKYKDTSLSFQERAEDIVSKMTPEQKCAQMKYDAPAIPSLGIEKYNWWNEGLHGAARAGTATVFPQAIGMAAIFSEYYVRTMAQIIGIEARAKYNITHTHGDNGIYKGLTIWSPNVNIYRDPRWGRGQETYGEDPFLTAELGKAYVDGLQGRGKYWTAAACVKHFACHSGPEATRHGFNAHISPKDMEETYLPHFREIITKTDVAGVMGAYNAVNGDPSCANPYLTDILRNEWGFKGYFVSDCWAIRDFHEEFGVTDNPIASAALAVNNQCDLNCGCTYEHLLSAYYKGKVKEEELDRSVTRLMYTRMKLGMFDVTALDDIDYDRIDTDEHRLAAFDMAARSMVLLKNKGLLPFDTEKIRTIAVIGPNADRKEALEGNYCGTASGYVTLLDGIKDRFDGRVLYAQGCDVINDRVEKLAEKSDRLAEALAAAEIADAVVLCLGLDASLEGEQGDTGNSYAAGDKTDLSYPAPQAELIKQVTALGKPVVLVTCSGGGLNPQTDLDDARIQAWYPGEEGGSALAAILFGDISPSGKLPVTFYKEAEKLPAMEDYSMENRTYRYADKDNILYPFGFGLTYTDIRVNSINWRRSQAGGVIFANIENIGDYDSEDVLQVYIKINSPDAVKNHSLCAFTRVGLRAGQTKTVMIPVNSSAFTVVDENGTRYIDGGADYEVYVDFSQPTADTKRLRLSLDMIGNGQ